MFYKTFYTLPFLATLSVSTCLASNHQDYTPEERAFLGLPTVQTAAPEQTDVELQQVLEASRQAAEADINRVLEKSRQEAIAAEQLKAVLEQSELEVAQARSKEDANALTEEEQAIIASQISSHAERESIDADLDLIRALEASSRDNDVDADTLAQIAAMEQAEQVRRNPQLGSHQPTAMDRDAIFAKYLNLRDMLQQIDADIADKEKFPFSFQQYKALVKAMRNDPQTMRDELALNAMKKSAAKAAELKALLDRRTEWNQLCTEMENQLDALTPKPSYGANNNNNNNNNNSNNNEDYLNNNNNLPITPAVVPVAQKAPGAPVKAEASQTNAEVMEATDAEYKISLQRDSYRTITAKLEELEAQIQPTRTAIANIGATIPELEEKVASLKKAYEETYGGDRVQGNNFGLKQQLRHNEEKLATLRLLMSEIKEPEARLAALRAQKAELEKQMQDKK